MNVALFDAISLISSFIVVVPLAISLLIFKRLTRVQKRLILLLGVSLIVEVISNVFWYANLNNNPVYHIYTALEFVLILAIYSEFLEQFISKKVLISIGIGFAAYCMLNALIYQDLKTFNSNTLIALSYAALFLSLWTLYSILKTSQSSLNKNPIFLISTALLLYFSSSLVLFYVNHSVVLTASQSLFLWGIHGIINCISILIYTRALWVQPTKM
jgi:hypothetical protein